MTTMTFNTRAIPHLALALLALCLWAPGVAQADIVDSAGCSRGCTLTSPSHGTVLTPGQSITVSGSQGIDDAYSPTRAGHQASCSVEVLIGVDADNRMASAIGTISGSLSPNVLGPANQGNVYRCTFSGTVTIPPVSSLRTSVQNAINSGQQVILIVYPMLNDLTTGEMHVINIGSFGEHVTFNVPPATSRLTVNKSGPSHGTVTSNPAGINCGTSCGSAPYDYAQNTSVTLTATAASGYTFSSWSGDACAGSASPTCTVTMNAAKTVTANFTTVGGPPPASDITLTVTKAGTVPGTVSSNPAGITSCSAVCTAPYAQDTGVILTASHGADVTVEWTGCDTVSGDFCTVTMNTSRSVTATFTCPAGFAWNSAQNECVPAGSGIRTLTVYKEGTGSGVVTGTSVNTAGTSINCGSACVAGYPQGDAVDLVSTPSGNSVFAGWSGACSGTQTTCTVTMNTDQTVTATYTCAPGYSWDSTTGQCAMSYCGSAQGGTYTAFPADDTLCASGATASNKQSIGMSFVWNCTGTDGTSACSATRQRGGAR